ncbi:hypothetical protein Plo01_33250 [Planobispora longispora]|uniref:Uncharacterized protein n=2 Tax=Planobispora longispora TaxID=28887 RepID=A0A8J3RMN7_9ACTN|nr:hypothetical protein Plo01_33250 [Planobispora longispora]
MTFMKRFLTAAAVVPALVLAGTASAEAAAVPDFPKPKIFGKTFQPDPGHDFSKKIHSRKDGILRGWITHVRRGTAEYEPIRWKPGKHTEGRFVGPPEGDVMAYASPVAADVVFLSAFGCGANMAGFTVDRNTGLGNKRCSRKQLLARAAKHGQPSLITVYRGRIVKVQEIYTP